MKKEYGGYLPIELSKGSEYFSNIDDKNILRVNSGRTALYIAIKALSPKKIHAPYYNCPDVEFFLNSLDIPVEYYKIDKDLAPSVPHINENEVLILINYFGITGSIVKKYADIAKNVIIDNSQAFFEPPVMRRGIINIYSPRKFIGVSDGGYAIGENIASNTDLPQDFSAGRASHLLVSLEEGTNAAYNDSQASEKALTDSFKLMSPLTRSILKNADYDHIKNIRSENFNYLHNAFKSIQLFSIEGGISSPYHYPLLLDKDIRAKLIQKKIYVPTLWKRFTEDNYENLTVEKMFSANTVFMPVDQRYNTDDMEYLKNTVFEILEGSAP